MGRILVSKNCFCSGVSSVTVALESAPGVGGGTAAAPAMTAPAAIKQPERITRIRIGLFLVPLPAFLNVPPQNMGHFGTSWDIYSASFSRKLFFKSSNDFTNDISVVICQAEIASVVTIRQLPVIESQQGQDGRVQVVD